MTVEINALTFSPVNSDVERGSDEFWQSSTRDVDVDDDTIDIFRKYIAKIISKPDTNQVSVGQFRDDDRSQEYLDEMLGLELDMEEASAEYDDFENVAESFSFRLIEEMSGNTNEGIFFVIQATWNGEPLISMLKLEPQDEERSVIDEDTRELRYEELDSALPDPDDFQKGCVYPLFESDNFSKSGDIKFLEDDGTTKYFPRFLGCDVGQGSRKQFQHTLAAVEETKETLANESLTSEDVQDFYDAVEEHGELTDDVAKETARDIVGPQFDDDDFERRLYEKGEEHISSDPDFAPSKVEWTIDGEIVIQVPVELLESDQIQISEQEHMQDEWEAVIRGYDVSKDYKQ
ncbi:nucleoid-associated protein [Halomicroarcula sp. F13]|uniref:Nucleoid-associated protein n=1 Tax=Haloarcula rubra TaxID=2487747 RepID=A0AAW4PVW3_9EURY|nr:nucleoid-associated protein [Halomicroarcula rubra]MBX0324789.1 nucleoid-associated protein [Halomicroarcula rubra]